MYARKELLCISTALGKAAATIAAMILILAGCATPPPVEEAKPMVWPAPPLTTRIRFVRSIVSEDDLKRDTTLTQGLAAFLTGEKLPEGRIAEPMALAVSDDGERLYVSDPMQHAVFTFDFKKKSFSKIEIGAPGGIALDAQENLYVVDIGKKSIVVYGRDGKMSNEFTDPTLERPLGLAIDRVNGKIYLVDTGARESKEHNVKIYSLQGKPLGALGGAPSGDLGKFSYPTFVCVDDKGNVYVSDTMNGRVQKFDSNGKFLTHFGQPGTAWGEFDKPKGVAVDSFGNVYVVDSGWSNVQIFNPKGAILLFFGGRGPLPGMLKNPISVAIDKQNRIYVGDYLNHRIGVYELVNTKADDSFINPPPNPRGK